MYNIVLTFKDKVIHKLEFGEDLEKAKEVLTEIADLSDLKKGCYRFKNKTSDVIFYANLDNILFSFIEEIPDNAVGKPPRQSTDAKETDSTEKSLRSKISAANPSIPKESIDDIMSQIKRDLRNSAAKKDMVKDVEFKEVKEVKETDNKEGTKE